MPMAALAVLDGAGLLTADGRLPPATVQELVGARICHVPRLHQVLVRPRHRLRRPRWADAPEFDIGRHVRVRPLPQPADEETLLAVCRELNERPPGDGPAAVGDVVPARAARGGASACCCACTTWSPTGSRPWRCSPRSSTPLPRRLPRRLPRSRPR
ncbi:hypothetical protein KTU01_00400 [Kocuria turfanensis]|uniref:O-acyltransferase WSD1-like N-terminal domain-containing protein n=1 Tax=Kocuria turfanensis TaxID=388357 RepID=A0A512I8C7_9MICC|nr:hypothetical protein KTU01_00400 [Kocuria turfanensis]